MRFRVLHGNEYYAACCDEAINCVTDGVENGITPQAMTPTGDNDTSVDSGPMKRGIRSAHTGNYVVLPYMILVAGKEISA